MSTNPTSLAELETPEHLRHHYWEWLVERIGWLVIATVLAAAIAGLIGPGLLSHRRVASADGTVTVEYDAFHRYQAPATLRIRVRPAETSGDLKLVVSRTFTDATNLEEIVPEPEVSMLSGEEVILTFQAKDLKQGELLLYRHQYDQFGSFTHRIGLAGQEPVQIEQWIFP